MRESEERRAVAAAREIATACGLTAGNAVVLQNSNKLTLRLVPGDVVARVGPVGEHAAQFEVDLARRLVAAGSPVAALDPRVEPRVHERDGFAITLWTYHETAGGEVTAAGYAEALRRLHAGMRTVDVPVPHLTQRIGHAQRLVADHDETPELPAEDRAVLGETLERVRRLIGEHGGTNQVLHGEPHPGNMLATADGPLFVDLETCCRGPVEFDVAHAPAQVAAHYPGLDQELLRQCRMLALAINTTWRWEPGDQLPDGRRLAAEWTAQIRAGLERDR